MNILSSATFTVAFITDVVHYLTIKYSVAGNIRRTQFILLHIIYLLFFELLDSLELYRRVLV